MPLWRRFPGALSQLKGQFSSMVSKKHFPWPFIQDTPEFIRVFYIPGVVGWLQGAWIVQTKEFPSRREVLCEKELLLPYFFFSFSAFLLE
jgi:hypothetical protein